MARFTRKDDSAKTNEANEPNETEVNEVISEPELEPEEDFDDLMASFSGDTEEVKEGTEMTDQPSDTEVQDAEVVEPTAEVNEPVSDTAESALSDAAKEIAEKATGHTVEMLDIASLPKTVPHIINNLATLNTLAEMVTDAVKEFEVGTGDTDKKVKRAIETLNEVDDPENFNRREAIAAAKAKIAELEELIETDETKLYADVEARLAEAGDVVWSEATINEKRQYITDMYAAYLQSLKGTEQFIDIHRKLKPADNVGTINQYHNKLDKPFKRSTSVSSTGVRRASGTARNVSVSDAQVSYDGGVTWHRAEGQLSKEEGAPVLSNPQFLAAEIARVSTESGSAIRDRLYSEWYAANGSADGTPIESDKVQPTTEFDFTYKAKPDGADAVAKVKLTKKGATVEV